MFEAVITSNVKGGGSVLPQTLPIKALETTGDQQSPGREQVEQTGQKAGENRQSEERPEVTQKMLDALEKDIESIHSIGLTFSRHKETGRTIIKVMDKQSHELIREIPSEEVLNLAAKIDEMIGILFDKKV